MRRGHDIEPAARRWYGELTGEFPQQVGIVATADGRCSCSPDGLLPDRGLEIKCPLWVTQAFRALPVRKCDCICADQDAEYGKQKRLHFIAYDKGGICVAVCSACGTPKAPVPPTQYLGQLQFSMWVTGLPAWDWVSYVPPSLRLPSIRITVKRDPKLMALYNEHIPAALAQMDEWEAKLRGML
jgi:hypothetical protein